MTRYLDCPACAGEQPFEQPFDSAPSYSAPFDSADCRDGHGVDCPEWLCLMCGAAVILGHSPRLTSRVTTAAA